MINKQSKIYIAGHNGMVGSAIYRLFVESGYNNLLTKNRQELDLLNGEAVAAFFEQYKPEYVILSAAKVGGISANMNNPATFLYDNLVIQNNVIHNAYLSGTKKIVFLASSCIYPRECSQPMQENMLLTGKLEPTNEGYALAKIAGIKLLESYRRQHGFQGISLLPCNLYGTNDSFHPENAHVLSSLVRKFVDAVDNNIDTVEVWGTGIARREFMHVDDCANAAMYLLEQYNDIEPINVGTGTDVSIKELATIIADEVGFTGNIAWNTTKPDGMLKKCLDISKITTMGFKPSISLQEGIRKTIKEYRTLKTAGNI